MVNILGILMLADYPAIRLLGGFYDNLIKEPKFFAGSMASFLN